MPWPGRLINNTADCLHSEARRSEIRVPGCPDEVSCPQASCIRHAGVRVFWSLFHKGTNLTPMRASTMTQLPQRFPSTNHHTALGFQHVNLVGQNIQLPALPVVCPYLRTVLASCKPSWRGLAALKTPRFHSCHGVDKSVLFKAGRTPIPHAALLNQLAWD